MICPAMSELECKLVYDIYVRLGDPGWLEIVRVSVVIASSLATCGAHADSAPGRLIIVSMQ